MKPLKTVLLILAVVVGSVAGTAFYMSHLEEAAASGIDQPQAAKAVTPPMASGPIFVALEPFTVTLRDEFSNRILYAAITLRVDDEASRQVLNDYMPEVRDRVLLALAQQDPKHVQAPETRQQLARSLGKVLEAPYLPAPQRANISHVLFTAFVVQ